MELKSEGTPEPSEGVTHLMLDGSVDGGVVMCTWVQSRVLRPNDRTIWLVRRESPTIETAPLFICSRWMCVERVMVQICLVYHGRDIPDHSWAFCDTHGGVIRSEMYALNHIEKYLVDDDT